MRGAHGLPRTATPRLALTELAARVPAFTDDMPLLL
jgi:hypothetical protein